MTISPSNVSPMTRSKNADSDGISQPPQARPDAQARPARAASNRVVVEASNIVKHYGDLAVLHDVSLRVKEGTVTTIIGASGSGKSTLLRCMNLLERPDRGELSSPMSMCASTATAVAASSGWIVVRSSACAPRSPWSSSSSICGRT